MLRPLGDKAQRERAHALLFFGLGMLDYGEDPDMAKGRLQESLALFEALDDEWGSGTAMCMLGEATLAMEQYPQAERLLKESVVSLTRIGNQPGIAYAQSALGRLAQQQGQMSHTLGSQLA
jgi:hypothetical protein